MSTQLSLAGLGHNNDNKKFRYTLQSTDYGSLTMYNIPEGWNEGELTFIRDPKYKGVLESFSTNSFEFVKESRDYIQTAYEAKGIDYEIKIYIDILVNSTFKYQRYFTGKLDLSTYDINSISVKCEIIPTGFQNVVLNRSNIEVDLLNTKFIGGGEGSMAQISGMPTTTNMPVYTAIINADWIMGTTDPFPGVLVTTYNYVHYAPLLVNATEFESGEAGSQYIDLTSKLFTAAEDRTIELTVNVTVYFTAVSGTGDFTMNLNLRQNVTFLRQDTSSILGVSEGSITFTWNETIVLLAGDTLQIDGESTGTVDYYFDYTVANAAILEDLGASYPAISFDSFAIFEFTARILQLISGNADPLDSDLLGRTDSSPVSYGSDGDLSLMTMTKGLLIREFITSQQTFNGSLDSTFTTLNGLWNIGLGFENGKVKIEKEAYFFDITDNPDYPATDSRPYLVNQILDIISLVTDEIISKAVLPDWYANQITSGYSNFEYEAIQGLKEFNTKSNYATPIASVKNTLDLVADYRYDTQGVNKLRGKPYSTSPTEDVNGDNDVFGFDVKRAAGFTVKTDEDFIYVTGGVDPTQSYNLNFTPRLNLERHGNRIRSMRLALGDEIQWMQSEKNTKLITRKTGESQKPENGDITVQDLTDGYWIPEAYSVEAPVDETTVTALQANPRGVIKIASDKWGWMLEVQTNNDSKKGQFKLLRMDATKVKVVV